MASYQFMWIFWLMTLEQELNKRFNELFEAVEED